MAWYGEVQTVDAPYGGGCTSMGNGIYGSKPGSAVIKGMGYWTKDTAGGHHHWAKPRPDNQFGNSVLYNMGDRLSASWMTYGGPGGIVESDGVSRPCL
jgi:hypothetical protein